MDKKEFKQRLYSVVYNKDGSPVNRGTNKRKRNVQEVIGSLNKQQREDLRNAAHKEEEKKRNAAKILQMRIEKAKVSETGEA